MHAKTWCVIVSLSLRCPCEAVLSAFGSGVLTLSVDVRIVLSFLVLSVVSCRLVRQSCPFFF